MNFLRGIRPKLLMSFSLFFIIYVVVINLIPADNSVFRMIFSLVMLGVYIFIGNWILSTWILTPLYKLINLSKKLVDNDLSENLEMKTGDEFEFLASTYNDMLKNLRTVLQENLNASEQLALAASEMCAQAEQANCATQEITGTMQKMAVATEEQFDNVQLSVTATQQMSENAQQVAVDAQKASGFSNQAAERAKTGEDIVQEVYFKIMQVKETVDGSAEVVRRLGASSAEIGKIVDVMRGISRQTNLLALNAAIEAARAGEHGRGFSVVADEVRVLAEQSTQSASQIVSMINEIQSETKSAVEAMEVGTKVVDEGTSLAMAAKDAFSHITDAVNETVNTIHEIAASSEEQAASSKEMSSTMQGVAAISKENVSASNQVTATTTEQRHSMESLTKSAVKLVDMADHLTALVGRFKVKSNFQRCWRVHDCNQTTCPAYHSKEEKCWLVANTLQQNGAPAGTIAEKRKCCHQCQVFKINTNA